MITYKTGDLLSFTEDAFGHGCNSFSTMGAGVALAVKRKYPQMALVDKDFLFAPQKRLGFYSSCVLPNGKTGFNIYSQYRYGTGLQLDYQALKDGLNAVADNMNQTGLKSLALPKIGSGLAGGDWKVIEQII